MPLLNYDDVIAISYVSEDIAVLLTPEQQSFLVQAAALFQSGYLWQDYLANRDDTDALVAASEQALLTAVTIPVNSINYEHTHWHMNSQNDVGNVPVITIRTTQIMNHFAAQNPSALNDEWESASFWIPASQPMLFDAYGIKGGSSGILTYDLRKKSDDSVLVSMTQDLYAAVAVDNFKFQLSYTAPEDLEVYLHGKVASKNAASSGYTCALTCIMVRS